MKISEARLRREAKRQGYRITRSNWRAGSVDNLGHWQVIDAYRNIVEFGARYDATDEEVAEFLGLTKAVAP